MNKLIRYIFIGALFAGPASWGEGILIKDWEKNITSTNSHERLQAANAVVSAREEIISNLVEIAQSPIIPGESFYDPNVPRNIAIRLLGEMKAYEALDVIIERLIPDRYQDGTSESLQIRAPALNALVEMDRPALEYLTDLNNREKSVTKKNAIDYAIKEIQWLKSKSKTKQNQAAE